MTMTRAMKDWHRWVLRFVVAILAAGFVAAHGLVIYGAASGAALPLAGFASGMIVIAMLKHLGLLGALWAALRRRFF